MANHLAIKDYVLHEINNTKDYKHIKADNGSGDISKTDWYKCTDFERPWVCELTNSLQQSLAKAVGDMGYAQYSVRELWFQQYHENSWHGWHVHGCNWTSVYYLEYPDTAPRTQLLNPMDQKTIIAPETYEGCILTFPSFVIHQAPTNQSGRKTIVSFNMDTMIADEHYQN